MGRCRLRDTQTCRGHEKHEVGTYLPTLSSLIIFIFRPPRCGSASLMNLALFTLFTRHSTISGTVLTGSTTVIQPHGWTWCCVRDVHILLDSILSATVLIAGSSSHGREPPVVLSSLASRCLYNVNLLVISCQY